ncbi:sugar transferase [bacterium]|nr:sugar transferase [bacterium]
MLKRVVDVAIAVCGIIVLAPVFLALAVAVKATSPGPVIFRQRRVGLHRAHFEMYKFRTMRVGAPSEVPTHLMANGELHITSFGRFLRKTSLDELPQLFNVLRGEMSIVGPRPALWNQYDLIQERERLGANDVRPGLTGWAQINGRDELAIAEKAALDGYYVTHQGFLFDMRCILATITSVLTARGVTEGNSHIPDDSPDVGTPAQS